MDLFDGNADERPGAAFLRSHCWMKAQTNAVNHTIYIYFFNVLIPPPPIYITMHKYVLKKW